MASEPPPTPALNQTKQPHDPLFYAVIAYEDPYVQPLIISALEKHFPNQYISGLPPSPESPFLQILPYESLSFDHALAHPTTSLINAYIIRKALIRKHYLATTVETWIVKHPESILKTNVVAGENLEVDYAEFLDEAVLECWGLQESWGRNEARDAAKEVAREEREEDVFTGDPQEREYWILKPGMSDRGQGIRLFSSMDELTAIFEEWDPDSDDEEEEEDKERALSGDDETDGPMKPTILSDAITKQKGDDRIITSHLRHFTAQPYIHPPLLLSPPSPFSLTPAPRKFHIRTYVLATAALRVYVYKPMLALFAAAPYVPPWSTSQGANSAAGLRGHLTNTCLQDSGEREGSVSLFWSLPSALPSHPSSTDWKSSVFSQICAVTGEVFEAAARGMGVHFQTLPNAFEVFGLDFLVKDEGDGRVTAFLLEVNAFPDFKQTGGELRDVVGGLWEGVVGVAVGGFFGVGGEVDERMVKVLDVDMGRR